MRTRIDLIDYYDATEAQQAEVDAYLEHIGRSRNVYGVTAVEATAEGAVRVERHAGLLAPPAGWGYVFSSDPACDRCGRRAFLGWVGVHETLRPDVPPPWLAWPDPAEGDPCE